MTENTNIINTEATEAATPATTAKKIRIVGDAVVVTSDLTLDELKTIQKFNPKALTLMGGDEGKTPVFAMSIAKDGYGGLTNNGIMWAPATNDAAKKATMTMMIPAGTEKPTEWFVDNFGGAIMNLNALEANLPAALSKLNADKATVMASIAVC